MIDGYAKFLAENTSLMNPTNPQKDNVRRLADADSYGLHVIVSTSNWIGLGLELQGQIKTVWELKLGTGGTTTIKPKISTAMTRIGNNMIKPQELIPADQPGRGINSDGEVLRFAAGRLDGQASMDDLENKIREAAAQITQMHAGERAVPRPAMLPALLPAHELPRDLGAEKVALGLRGADLTPWVVDFAEVPLLGVYGDKFGKTNLLRLVLRSVARQRSGPDDAIIVVIDLSRRLMAERQLLIEGHDYYETDVATAVTRIHQLTTAVLPQRTPPANLDWEAKAAWTYTGPKIYLIVDDADTVPLTVTLPGTPETGNVPQQVSTWQALKPYLESARDKGLRFIMAHKAAEMNMNEAMPNALPAVFKATASNRVLLNSRHTKESVSQVKFEDDLLPGRGFLITPDSDGQGYVQLALADEMLPPC